MKSKIEKEIKKSKSLFKKFRKYASKLEKKYPNKIGFGYSDKYSKNGLVVLCDVTLKFEQQKK